MILRIVSFLSLLSERQDRVIDRDPADADDVIGKLRITVNNYRIDEFQSRNLGDDSTDVKDEGMITDENKEGKHRNYLCANEPFDNVNTSSR